MNYELYLFIMLYRQYCTEFDSLEYEEQYEVAPMLQKVFLDSKFNDPNRDLYTCIALWLDSIDWTYHITCGCGHWEEMPADMPRHKTQTFKWIKNSDLNATAYYKCPDCSTTVRSEIIPDFGVGYKTKKTII